MCAEAVKIQKNYTKSHFNTLVCDSAGGDGDGTTAEEGTEQYNITKITHPKQIIIPKEVTYTEYFTEQEIDMLTALIENESVDLPEDREKIAPLWCVFNRIDGCDFPDTAYDVLTQGGQFMRCYPPIKYTEHRELVIEQCELWIEEKDTGYPIDGRPIPSKYTFYSGSGLRNNFRNQYEINGAVYWDWDWDNE